MRVLGRHCRRKGFYFCFEHANFAASCSMLLSLVPDSWNALSFSIIWLWQGMVASSTQVSSCPVAPTEGSFLEEYLQIVHSFHLFLLQCPSCYTDSYSSAWLLQCTVLQQHPVVSSFLHIPLKQFCSGVYLVIDCFLNIFLKHHGKHISSKFQIYFFFKIYWHGTTVTLSSIYWATNSLSDNIWLFIQGVFSLSSIIAGG